MTDKLRDAAQQNEREAFEAWVAKVQPTYWRAEAWQTEAWAMWQSISAALAQQDAQKKHKPLFAEMIAQHPGLAEELAQQDAQPESEAVRSAWLAGYTEAERQMMAQQDAQAVVQGWIPPSGLKIADIGFRWDSDALQHVPHVLVEFEPVPANLPNTEKGWADRDAFVEMLNAAPTTPAQTNILKP